MTDIVREQFEAAWADVMRGDEASPSRKPARSRIDPDAYAGDAAQFAWKWWKRSREPLTVTLPALREDSDADDIAGVGLVIPMFDRGYDEALEEARVAIESVGIRVEFEE